MSTLAYAQQARRAYQQVQVQNDDPLGLVVQLYDGMLQFLQRAIDALEQGNKVQAHEPIRRAIEIVGELQAVLDLKRGGDVATNLDRIYGYCRRRIMESHVKSSSEGLHEVRRLLGSLRDAWAEARMKQLGAASELAIGAAPEAVLGAAR